MTCCYNLFLFTFLWFSEGTDTRVLEEMWKGDFVAQCLLLSLCEDPVVSRNYGIVSPVANFSTVNTFLTLKCVTSAFGVRSPTVEILEMRWK